VDTSAKPTASRFPEINRFTSSVYSFRNWFIRFYENRLATVGLGIVVIMFFVAVFAPQISLYDPTLMNLRERLAPLSAKHPFGTDNFGRDTFSRVVYGARISIVAGAGSVGLALIIGLILGAVAGYSGRSVDNIIMRIMDAVMAFPGLLLAIALMTALGASLTNVCIALGIRYTPDFGRLVRASVLKEREKEYVEAARAIGEGDGAIMIRYVLPNTLSPLIVQATAIMSFAILAEAAISYLGLGTRPPTPSWGLSLAEGSPFMWAGPHLVIFPGLAIAYLVLAFNFLGDGLRDIFDPRYQA